MNRRRSGGTGTPRRTRLPDLAVGSGRVERGICMAALTPDAYRLISADSHVNEPPDLWTSRVPAKFRDRAPRIERFDDGDAWVLEGVQDPINFGMNACAGLPPTEMRGWCRFEDIRRGGSDPAGRT